MVCRDEFVVEAWTLHHSVNLYFKTSTRSCPWRWTPVGSKIPSLSSRPARHLLRVYHIHRHLLNKTESRKLASFYELKSKNLPCNIVNSSITMVNETFNNIDVYMTVVLHSTDYYIALRHLRRLCEQSDQKWRVLQFGWLPSPVWP